MSTFGLPTEFDSIAPASKKRRESSPEPTSTSNDHVDALPIELDKEVYLYWTSGDARKRFVARLIYDSTCNVRKVALERIEKLEKANHLSAYWKALIDGGDQENLCSKNDIFIIRTRCLYLTFALCKFVVELIPRMT